MPTPMLFSVVRWFVPAQSGTGLVPADGYLAKFYAAGTDTPKEIYHVDGTPYSSPSSVAILNSEGYAALKLGTGAYKLVICLPEVTPSASGGDAIYTEDGIQGNGSFGTGFVNVVVDGSGTTGLKDADTAANKFVYCAGYYAIGDGGHGFFWNETSSASDDGGYIIASTSDPTKRWFRIPDESNDVRAASFGYIGTLAQDLTSQFSAAASYSQANGLRLVVGPGSAATMGISGQDLDFYTGAEIHMEPGSVLTANTGVLNLRLYGKVTGYAEVHFVGFTGVVIVTPQVLDLPEWFGATPAAENTAAFTAWLNCMPNGGAFILPPGDWHVTNGGLWPYGGTLPILMFGSIHGAGDSGFIPTGFWGASDSQLKALTFLLENGISITSGGAGIAFLNGELDLTTLVASGDATALNVIGTNSVESEGSVIAGSAGGSGRVIGRAGTAIKSVPCGGQYWIDVADYTSSGTTLQDLGTATIYANSLTTEGEHLRLTVGGEYTADGTSSQQIQIFIGAANIAPLDVVPQHNPGVWQVFVDIWRTTTGVRCLSRLEIIATYDGSSSIRNKYVNDTSLDFTTTLTMHVKVQVTAFGQITQRSLMLEYFPAPQ